jgi:hypothetical protein
MNQSIRSRAPGSDRTPRLPDPLTDLVKTQEFARLKSFLDTGFSAFEGSTATHYKVDLVGDVKAESLFVYLKTKVAEIPCSVIGIAGNATLRMFRMAEEEGLVTLEVTNITEVPPGKYT